MGLIIEILLKDTVQTRKDKLIKNKKEPYYLKKY